MDPEPAGQLVDGVARDEQPAALPAPENRDAGILEIDRGERPGTPGTGKRWGLLPRAGHPRGKAFFPGRESRLPRRGLRGPREPSLGQLPDLPGVEPGGPAGGAPVDPVPAGAGIRGPHRIDLAERAPHLIYYRNIGRETFRAVTMEIVKTVLAWAAFAAFHSLTVSEGYERLARRAMGERSFDAFHRLLFTAYSAAATAATLLYVHSLPDAPLYRIEGWAGIALRAAQASGAALLLWTPWDLLEFIGLRRPQRRRLFTGKAYGIVRHPIYLGFSILLAFHPVQTRNSARVDRGDHRLLLPRHVPRGAADGADVRGSVPGIQETRARGSCRCRGQAGTFSSELSIRNIAAAGGCIRGSVVSQTTTFQGRPHAG